MVLSIPQNSPLAACSILPTRPKPSLMISFVSATRSPLVSQAFTRLGGSPISAQPLSRIFSARGSTSLSWNTVRLSKMPSPFVSSRMAMSPTGSVMLIMALPTA